MSETESTNPVLHYLIIKFSSCHLASLRRSTKASTASSINYDKYYVLPFLIYQRQMWSKPNETSKKKQNKFESQMRSKQNKNNRSQQISCIKHQIKVYPTIHNTVSFTSKIPEIFQQQQTTTIIVHYRTNLIIYSVDTQFLIIT